MILRNKIFRKVTAYFFLCVLSLDIVMPQRAFALTSGPAQPEFKQFEPAGTNDMVDLFTGDFKYNIPLMDIDGYPLNLNYRQGSGMDDEASWVGLGWSLDVGSITRQLRGVADDADGDEVVTESYMKPKITVGGVISSKIEIFGIKAGKKGGASVSGSFGLGVFDDNYTGIGAEVFANSGISLTFGNSNQFTPGVNVGFSSNTQDGVSVNSGISLSYAKKKGDHTNQWGSVGYNISSREGNKSSSLSSSFKSYSFGVRQDYNTPPSFPSPNLSFKSKNFTLEADIGGEVFSVYMGGGVKGYKTVREINDTRKITNAFGYMYSQHATANPNASLDFMREKDNPVIEEMKNVAVPIATHDLFTYTSQAGSGQIRLYRGGTGVLAENDSRDITETTSIGVEFGTGNLLHGGVNVYNQDIVNKVGKWRGQNSFLKNGDFQQKLPVEEEDAYFKNTNEQNVDNNGYADKILDENPVRVAISNKVAQSRLKVGSVLTDVNAPLKKDGRQVRVEPISYVTAKNSVAAFDKKITNYPLLDESFVPVLPSQMPEKTTIERKSDLRKNGHITEMTVQAGDGKRMVYGLPVYNNYQHEYTFAVRPDQADPANKLVNFELDEAGKIKHRNGVDHYYVKQQQPGYASAFLLTAILSPDYQDLTGDGITEDDLGTAIKFNYSKMPVDYTWRTPYVKAQYNPALRADPDDDKGSIVIGQKEVWFLQSIETKTKVAYFITEDRQDALGSKFAGGPELTCRQRALKEIWLYSKSDLNRPLKKVVMQHDYSLCQGTPNSVSEEQGKLTLKRLHFLYNGSSKGAEHPYVFNYNSGQRYDYLSTDKWGTLKTREDNSLDEVGNIPNDEFPYAVRDYDRAKSNAGMWQLSQVELPTGGKIDVTYESDDYAYVQDRRAMEMVKLVAMLDNEGNPTDELRKAKRFRIKLDEQGVGLLAPDQHTNWFVNTYLDGKAVMYGRFFVNLSDEPDSGEEGYFDYVHNYGSVKQVRLRDLDGDGNYEYADVEFRENADIDINQNPFVKESVNPFVEAAWQKMRLEYPRYAFLGYRNRVSSDKPIAAALNAVLSAYIRVSDLWKNFNMKAYDKRFANNIELSKSFMRVVKADGFKLGGGARVKSIRLSDGWDAMASGEATAVYGQAYSYKMTEDGREISSGVAAYEPAFGGDENPLRLPSEDTYKQKAGWHISNYFYMEEPISETLFPAPGVGYRMVKVENLNEEGEVDQSHKTGWQEYKFYTAKEFPVEIKQTQLDKIVNKPKTHFSLFGASSLYELTMSQGYTVTLNDMHGKPLEEITREQSGKEIAATKYYYASEENGGRMRLKNKVTVVDEQGKISENQVMGRSIDMFVDMREAETANKGTTRNFGWDSFTIGYLTLAIPHFPKSTNNDYRLFRSASVLKTIEYKGFVTKVEKRIDGSKVEASNLIYDKNTGTPVVTSSRNEFNDPVYSVNIPAYWNYEQMGMSYKNMGHLVLTGLATTSEGEPTGEFAQFLSPGDELVDITTGQPRWVIKPTQGASAGSLRIIDATGRLITEQGLSVQVRYSGYRNQLGASLASFTSMEYPVDGDYLMLKSKDGSDAGWREAYRVLDAKAVLYNDAWGKPYDCEVPGCPPGYVQGPDGRCMLNAIESPLERYQLVKATGDKGYGTAGTFLMNESATTHYAKSTADYFKSCENGVCGRLSKIGVWSKSLAAKTWWGFEFCVDIPEDGDYHVGYGADNIMFMYVDNQIKDRFCMPDKENENNHRQWKIRKMALKAGKRVFRVHAFDKGGLAAVGIEIYDKSLSTGDFQQGNPSYIASKTLFSTESLPGTKVSVFDVTNDGRVRASTGRFTCAKGNGSLNVCDGTPNCGYFEAGTCPPGYTKSTDGQQCIPDPLQIDPSPDMLFVPAEQRPYYTTQTIFYKPNGTTQEYVTSAGSWGEQGANCPQARMASSQVTTQSSSTISYCSRLNQLGVWLGGDFGIDKWIGVNTCFTVPRSGTYYIGFSADSHVKIYIDGDKRFEKVETGRNTVDSKWYMHTIALEAGNHKLTIESKPGPANTVTNPALPKNGGHAVGLEIYDAHITFLRDGPVMSIFSTNQLIGKNLDTYVLNADGTVFRRRVTVPTGGLDVCAPNFGRNTLEIDNAINPYLRGYLGVWLPWKVKTWLTNLSGQDLIDKAGSAGVAIRRNGHYEKFKPFWYLNTSGNWTNREAETTDWVTAQTVTLYDHYSHETENVNALNQYSGARYGFKESQPVAVSANAQQREVFYDGFDDYHFNQVNQQAPLCRIGNFDIRQVLGSNYSTRLDANAAHSGNYSLKLGTDPLILNTIAFTEAHTPGIYLGNNSRGEYYRDMTEWRTIRKFAPMPNKKYIFSAWVKDNGAPSAKPQLDLKMVVGAGPFSVDFKHKATVEGWKLIEAEMNWNISGQMNTAAVILTGGNANVLIDDIRIFPYDGQLKSYTYDDRTLRLMAELDENNYATFYEYDDEGSLVRVKKETERGIITIKESRNSLKKKLQ